MSRRFLRLKSERLANPTAFAIAAAAMLVPANVLPILTTRTMGQVRTDTIFSGTVALWRQELWAIAAIVFVASILIPVLKLAGLGWLLVAAHRGRMRDPRRLTRLYEALDFHRTVVDAGRVYSWRFWPGWCGSGCCRISSRGRGSRRLRWRWC